MWKKTTALLLSLCIACLPALSLAGSLDAFATQLCPLPDAAACFGGESSASMAVDEAGLPVGTGYRYDQVSAQQAQDYIVQALALGYANDGTQEGLGWQAQVLRYGDARIAVVYFEAQSFAVLLLEDGFTFSAAQTGGLAAFASGDTPAGSPPSQGAYLRLTVDGQIIDMQPVVSGIVPDAGTVTARTFPAGFPVDSGLRLGGDTVYMGFTDGTDSFRLIFPAQVKSGSVIDPSIRRSTMLLYDCESALDANARGFLYSTYGCVDVSYVSEAFPLNTTFRIEITQTDAAHSFISGTFTGELGNFMTSVSVSGEFSIPVPYNGQ